MNRSFYGYIVGALLATTSIAAHAAIEAGSYLAISDFVITNVATGDPATVGLGGDITSLIIASETASARAEMNGLVEFNPTVGSLDAPVAFSDGTSTVDPGIENTFSPRPLGITLPYARGDTAGSGSAVSPVGGPVTTGASLDSIADVVIPNTAVISNLGTAAATALQTIVTIIVPSTVTLSLDFDYLLDQTLDYSLPPSGLLLRSEASFAAQVIGAGITVGGAPVAVFTYSPSELNTSIARSAPGVTNPGDGTAGSLSSPDITLAPGVYTLSITQSNFAEITIVPEMTSMLTWTVIVLCGGSLAGIRRRRDNG
jgi:hypothetical protein